MRTARGKPFMYVEADAEDLPVFSEAFLYERIGKGDARFVLGVAEEYEHVIAALGPEAVRAILDVNPRLAQRLGTGATVTESLADARDERPERYPVQVILDADAARACWRFLHSEYRRFFDPEKSMDRDQLRAYNALTDALGEDEQQERAEERARLPEKLELQRVRKAALPRRKEAREAIREALSGDESLLRAFNDEFAHGG